VAQALRALEPPPPSVHRADIPWPIDALVRRMVASRPHERPASMAEVEAELRALLAGAPSAPTPVRAARSLMQSIARAWRSLRQPADKAPASSTSLVAPAGTRWQRLLAGARRAAVHHPRTSVAVITVALFLVAIGLFALVR
jgi:hypothetical protein